MIRAGIKKRRTRQPSSRQRAKSSDQIQIYRDFLSVKHALRVRSEFDAVYADERSTHPKRFLWDHWELPGQYRLHRTLARDFFSPAGYKLLKDQLVRFGQEHLGCHSISEPWLSYYTEGDEQNLHTDSPHGPWAYVYSLTDWDAHDFSGGETFILRPETLDYWSNYSRSCGREFGDLNFVVPARFNQLTVFDPRLPHGVRRVSGTHDPRRSRLVVHGWFVNPEPYVVGALNIRQVTRVLEREMGLLLKAAATSALQNLNMSTVPMGIEHTLQKIALSLAGIIVLRLQISSKGAVRSVRILTNTLVNTNASTGHNPYSKTNSTQLRDVFINAILKNLKTLQFPSTVRSGTTQLTLPLLFD